MRNAAVPRQPRGAAPTIRGRGQHESFVSRAGCAFRRRLRPWRLEEDPTGYASVGCGDRNELAGSRSTHKLSGCCCSRGRPDVRPGWRWAKRRSSPPGCRSRGTRSAGDAREIKTESRAAVAPRHGHSSVLNLLGLEALHLRLRLGAQVQEVEPRPALGGRRPVRGSVRNDNTAPAAPARA